MARTYRGEAPCNCDQALYYREALLELRTLLAGAASAMSMQAYAIVLRALSKYSCDDKPGRVEGIDI